MPNREHNNYATRAKLECLRCSNVARFVQFSTYAAELVDAEGNHLELMHSETDRWECAECGGEAQWSEVSK